MASESSFTPASDGDAVSVIIPTFNHAQYLGAAIASVLAQTVPPWEIVVVDDGSSDDAAAVVRAFGDRVRYVRQDHQGIGAARNRGVQETRGALIAFLDADDLWPADKLGRQHEARRADPSIDVLFGRVEEFLSDDLDAGERRRLVTRDEAGGAGVIGTMLIDRASFERVGGFETQWRVGEFVEWRSRAIDAGLRLRVLPQVLLQRRIHRTNTTRRQADSRVDYVRIVKQSIDRRRVAASGAGATADPPPEE